MKTISTISCFVLLLLFSNKISGQGFVATVEDEGLAALYGNQCTLMLESGEEIQGKFAGGSYSSNGLSKISIKLENGEKAKFKPEQVISLIIKASVSEMANTDFNGIVKRDYLIFETALTAKKSDTYRLMQLLNPGFDSKIKVFAEPSKKTGGLNVGGIQLTGGEAKAYLFVKGKEKAVEVNKGSYSKNFKELYSDCPKMLSTFQGEKIKWDDIALHVFAYDQACK